MQTPDYKLIARWLHVAASASNDGFLRAEYLAQAALLEAQEGETVTGSMVDALVNAFLCWPLPQDFAPDCGISFNPGPTQHMPHCWPVGTNLLTAAQAKAMFAYLLARRPRGTYATEEEGDAFTHGWFEGNESPPYAKAPESAGMGGVDSFQSRVAPWMQECFGPEISADRLERGDRLLEETLELLQSGDYPSERVAAMVAYTWGRPKGEPSQEVGGVMVTLAAYCLAHKLNMHEAGEAELARILRPEIIAKIRSKQAAKARDIPFSPFPQDSPTEAVAFRCRIKGMTEWSYIGHRSPDTFELRECEIESLYTHPAATPKAEAREDAVLVSKDDELCEKCNFTLAGHRSNTGVIYPCWTPSGRYSGAAISQPKPTHRELRTAEEIQAAFDAGERVEYWRPGREEWVAAESGPHYVRLIHGHRYRAAVGDGREGGAK